jgi:serine phosphatase RsbU (regulator of sigma subunit)
MGKGVPAAMFAAILRPLLRAAPELTRQPAALLTRVNRVLFEDLSGVDMFITVQLAYVNAIEQRLVVASAGHCPLLVTSEDGRSVRAISPEGIPLGILPDSAFAEETVELPSDFSVLLYTDGLTEQTNIHGQRYGQERLAEWLRHTAATTQNADRLKQALANELTLFQGNIVLNDDQTFLIMMR